MSPNDNSATSARLQMPTLEEIHKAPIGWFPTCKTNPSKLIAHKFVNGEWIKLSFAKFVSWPEAFPDEIVRPAERSAEAADKEPQR